ncbi:2-(3-amino-3-carboxypropyl)histidine synthase subunit 2 [Paramyrothecium foliicola]|nr:2-(3-amino-3-carboxypropyl)histidine synthase subunit 2 [Paramyrothecium foliicola]
MPMDASESLQRANALEIHLAKFKEDCSSIESPHVTYQKQIDSLVAGIGEAYGKLPFGEPEEILQLQTTIADLGCEMKDLMVQHASSIGEEEADYELTVNGLLETFCECWITTIGLPVVTRVMNKLIGKDFEPSATNAVSSISANADEDRGVLSRAKSYHLDCSTSATLVGNQGDDPAEIVSIVGVWLSAQLHVSLTEPKAGSIEMSRPKRRRKRRHVQTDGDGPSDIDKRARRRTRASTISMETRQHTQQTYIHNPEPGGIYLAYWKKSREWSAVLILPKDHLEDVGVPGTLGDLGLLGDVPSCYIYSKRYNELRWASGYQDGGRFVGDRQFPVMYFDGSDFPQKSSVGWVAAKNLQAFEFDTTKRSLIPHYNSIRKYVNSRAARDNEVTGEGEAESTQAAFDPDPDSDHEARERSPTARTEVDAGPSNDDRMSQNDGEGRATTAASPDVSIAGTETIDQPQPEPASDRVDLETLSMTGILGGESTIEETPTVQYETRNEDDPDGAEEHSNIDRGSEVTEAGGHTIGKADPASQGSASCHGEPANADPSSQDWTSALRDSMNLYLYGDYDSWVPGGNGTVSEPIVIEDDVTSSSDSDARSTQSQGPISDNGLLRQQHGDKSSNLNTAGMESERVGLLRQLASSVTIELESTERLATGAQGVATAPQQLGTKTGVATNSDKSPFPEAIQVSRDGPIETTPGNQPSNNVPPVRSGKILSMATNEPLPSPVSVRNATSEVEEVSLQFRPLQSAEHLNTIPDVARGGGGTSELPSTASEGHRLSLLNAEKMDALRALRQIVENPSPLHALAPQCHILPMPLQSQPRANLQQEYRMARFDTTVDACRLPPINPASQYSPLQRIPTLRPGELSPLNLNNALPQATDAPLTEERRAGGFEQDTMSTDLVAPPVLSTPDDQFLDAVPLSDVKSTLSEDALRSTYEIDRTVAEIREGKWSRIGLQFPDHMLVDAPRVVEALEISLAQGSQEEQAKKGRIYVLADTSYSACCVDEIAAEHADADVVVHYGRTCLSPTSRLPVIYVYTSNALDREVVIREFEKGFSDKEAKVVIMADITYQSHVSAVVQRLNDRGYGNVVGTEVVRDPAGTIPNRRITAGPLEDDLLQAHSLFHISDPPVSLLLALQSRFASLHVLSTTSLSSPSLENPTFRTAGLLRRRYARVLSLAAAGVVGILVNTLSVSNYLSSIDVLRKKIAQAGKKSYTVVVGKLNPAKLANFAEVEGWVVIGCWESGLIEDDSGYWRPVVTPFEMEMALLSEDERVWGQEWWGGLEKLKLDDEKVADQGDAAAEQEHLPSSRGDDGSGELEEDDGVEGDESLPPQFDLRTGKFVSHSRPMRLTERSAKDNSSTAAAGSSSAAASSEALVKRTVGELASINGVASPGAEYLLSKRTWQGLGTDFDNEASTVVEEGRSGIARGYRDSEQANGDRH